LPHPVVMRPPGVDACQVAADQGIEFVVCTHLRGLT
jgi:hypothetical protein